MISEVTTQMIYASAALACALSASMWDLREQRIPNLLTGPAIVTGMLLHLILGGWLQLGSSIFAGLIGGGICALFYFAGGMGAGDVKLMIATGCLLGLYPLQLMLLITAAAGFAYALTLAIWKRRLKKTLRNVAVILAHHGREGFAPHPEINVSNPQALRMPFALPITAGCCAVLLSTLWVR